MLIRAGVISYKHKTQAFDRPSGVQYPTGRPTIFPTTRPTRFPTTRPSQLPTIIPTELPTKVGPSVIDLALPCA
jgi:hypothetical protein